MFLMKIYPLKKLGDIFNVREEVKSMKNREPFGVPEKSGYCAPETVMPLNNREQCNAAKNLPRSGSDPPEKA
jgi:hypothetical protein